MAFRRSLRHGINGALAAALVAGGLAAATATAGLTGSEARAADEQFIPLLVYRTGPYAPNGIPAANGALDYYKLVNERDGGINGVVLTFEECEFRYDTKAGVECYERLKNKGPTGASVVNPLSTGVTYQLNPRAPVDEVPVHSMGYGQTAASDGRVFPWTFTYPSSYWSQASAFIKYVGAQSGGMDKLQGQTIALVYHNSPYGKEPIPRPSGAGGEIRLCPGAAAGRPSGPGAEGDVVADPQAQARLGVPLGLGRDEPGRDQGGRRNRLSDGPPDRRLVVGE